MRPIDPIAFTYKVSITQATCVFVDTSALLSWRTPAVARETYYDYANSLTVIINIYTRVTIASFIQASIKIDLD